LLKHFQFKIMQWG